jgi:hypothetical protein
MQGELEAVPTLRREAQSGWRYVLSARIRLDGEDYLAPGRPDHDSYSDLSRPLELGNAGTLELRDVYAELDINDGIMRLGKQQIVWGRLDGIKVLDVLNPQSFREFILDEFDRSRISLWSAYIDKSFSAWRTELALIPDATGHEIPKSGAWFELTASRFRYGASPSDAVPEVVTERSNDFAAGLRVSRTLGPLDVAGVAYTGPDFEPLGRLVLAGTGVRLERFYERRVLYGASAELAFGNVALRTEIAYQPNRVFNTRQGSLLDIVERDQVRVAMGMDVDGPLDIFANIQYLVDRIEDAPAVLVRPERDRVVTAYLRRSFSYDTLDIEIRWYRSFDDGDSMISGGLGYALSDDTTVQIAYESFRGNPNGLFGQFAGRNRLTIGLEHYF